MNQEAIYSNGPITCVEYNFQMVLTIVELYKFTLKVSICSVSHFCFYHCRVDVNGLKILLMLLRNFHQNRHTFSLIFFLHCVRKYNFVQIESRRRFRIIRSWDQDGLVVSWCYVSTNFLTVFLLWKFGFIS